MNHQALVDFICNKMSMSHIYQPLLIKALLESGGTSSIRQLAIAVLNMDEAQIAYYEDRIKKMPVPVLSKHEIIEKNGDLISLKYSTKNLEEKSEIKLLCEQKIHDFIRTRKGNEFWDRFTPEPIPGDVRYEVLKRANKRCELCKVSEGDSLYEERLPLHIDHIIPRSKGGSNDIENLQVLCRACNQGKGNRDSTDFRK